MKKIIIIILLSTLCSCAKEYKKVKVVVFFSDGKNDTLSIYSNYKITYDNRLVHYSTNLESGTTVAKDVKYIKEINL